MVIARMRYLQKEKKKHRKQIQIERLAEMPPLEAPFPPLKCLGSDSRLSLQPPRVY